MKPVFKSLIVAGLLATAGLAAFSQPMMGGSGPMGHEGDMGMHGRQDPAKMEAWMAKRTTELKAKLKITAAEEGAWTAFTAAMKPSVGMQENRPDRADLAKLTTPERIDKMHALRTQRMADMSTAMDKRDEATKTFYATLSAEQKKTFDAEHARMDGRHSEHHKGWGRGNSADKAPTSPPPSK